MSCLIVCGPSGSGKSTLIKMLVEKYKESVEFAVASTTRGIRIGERNGIDYNFTNKEEFDEMVSNGQFVEYGTFCGNYYGTSRRAVSDIVQKGKVCIFDLDLAGVLSMKKVRLWKVTYVLVKPPSLEELKKRLVLRGDENHVIKERLDKAVIDMNSYDNYDGFDKIIVNDNLDGAFNELESVFVNLLKS